MPKSLFPVGAYVVTRFGKGHVTSWAENMKGDVFYSVQVTPKKIVTVSQMELVNNNI